MNKVILSIYNDMCLYHENVVKNASFTYAIQADLEKIHIEQFFKEDDEYAVETVIGDYICFIDIYCPIEANEKVIEHIKKIPQSNNETRKSKVRHIYGIYYEGSETLLPTRRVNVRYSYSYSKGAGSFMDWVLGASYNPWFMVVIGYIFGKVIDALFLSFINQIKRRCGKKVYELKRVPLNTKKLYSHVAKKLDVDVVTLQITHLYKPEKGNYEVKLRNHEGKRFDVTCKMNGKVISLRKREPGVG